MEDRFGVFPLTLYHFTCGFTLSDKWVAVVHFGCDRSALLSKCAVFPLSA